MNIIISFLFSIFILCLYLKNKKEYACLLILLFSTKLLGMVSMLEISVNVSIFSVAFIFVFCILKKVPLIVKKEPLAYIVNIFIVYFLIMILYSILLEVDSLGNILTVSRYYFFILIFYILATLNKIELESVLDKFFKIVLVVSVFTIVQRLAHGVVFGYDHSSLFVIRKIVPFSILSIYRIIFEKKSKYTLLFLSIHFSVIVMSSARTYLISFIVAIIIALLLTRMRYVHKLYRYGLFTGLLVCLFFPYISDRYFGKDYNNVGSDITETLKFKTNTDYSSFSLDRGDGGTFEFRFLMFMERIEYLLKNDYKIITGVGYIHEDSNANKFSFYLGSKRLDGKSWYEQMIDTDDLVWQPILFRTGILGVIMYCSVFFALFKVFRKESQNNKQAFLALLLLILLLINSFSKPDLREFSAMTLLFTYYFILRKSKKPEIKNIESNNDFLKK